jgi:hypothetical protein
MGRHVTIKALMATRPESPLASVFTRWKIRNKPAVAHIADGNLAAISLQPNREQLSLTSKVFNGGV